MYQQNAQNNVINFIDEINKKNSLDNAYSNAVQDPEVKLHRLDKTKQDGVNTCMNAIIGKVCQDSIPDINGKSPDVGDLDKAVSDFVARRSGGNDTIYYVKEAIKRNPKKTGEVKSILEDVEKIVRNEYLDRSLNPDSLTEEDFEFKMTPGIEGRLSEVIRNHNLDELSDVIKNNVRDDAVKEVELAKREKEERDALEEELMNDDEIKTESALEEALEKRNAIQTQVYRPSLFQAIMINKFSQMPVTESTDISNTVSDEYFTEGKIVSSIKDFFKGKKGKDAKESIMKNHATFLASVEKGYTRVYNEYKSVIFPIDVDKIIKKTKVSLAQLQKCGTRTVTTTIISIDDYEKQVNHAKETLKNGITHKNPVNVSLRELPANITVSLSDALPVLKKISKKVEAYFKKPSASDFVNKASKFVTPKVNSCQSPAEVTAVYEMSCSYVLADSAMMSVLISVATVIIDCCNKVNAKADKVAVKEAAFDQAIVEYTLLNISKALYLESFGFFDIDKITDSYLK